MTDLINNAVSKSLTPFVQKAGTGAVFQAKFDLSAKQKEIGLWGRGKFITLEGEVLEMTVCKKMDRNGREYLVLLQSIPVVSDTEKAKDMEIAELKARLKESNPSIGVLEDAGAKIVTYDEVSKVKDESHDDVPF
mgnify:FL=1